MLAGDGRLEAASAATQRREHDAFAPKLGPGRARRPVERAAARDQERVAVALELTEDVGFVPAAVVRVERELEPPRAPALPGRDRQLRTSRALAIRVRASADQTGRAEDGKRQFSAVEQLVLHPVDEKHRNAAGFDEAALGFEPALDDGELTLCSRGLSGSRERDVEAEPMVADRVVELE